MNRFVRDMLMNRRDSRNPYGPRGGYVMNRGPRRMDRMHEPEMERYGDDYARGRRNNDYNYSDSRRDYNRQEDRGYGYGFGMFDYDTEDYMYMDGHYKLSNKEIKKWERDLENADGSRGPKYTMEQVHQFAQQFGIKFDEFSPELLTAITNMFYSDYCKVLGNDLTVYVKLAKAFLEDDDFDGSPEEKAYLYYTCIVEKE